MFLIRTLYARYGSLLLRYITACISSRQVSRLTRPPVEDFFRSAPQSAAEHVQPRAVRSLVKQLVKKFQVASGVTFPLISWFTI